ncbi:hypothetical protein BDZ89DRAFT_1039608 [Hymenopellis radicata]|nr:hypothetical protein BDZ89DRAFT_1039608 [Hymenopellis radicata]
MCRKREEELEHGPPNGMMQPVRLDYCDAIHVKRMVRWAVQVGLGTSSDSTKMRYRKLVGVSFKRSGTVLHMAASVVLVYMNALGCRKEVSEEVNGLRREMCAADKRVVTALARRENGIRSTGTPWYLVHVVPLKKAETDRGVDNDKHAIAAL